MYQVALTLLATLAFRPLPALGATIPTLLDATANDRTHCTSLEIWTGGTPPAKIDCARVLDEIWNNDAKPRPSQEYEFVSHGAGRTTSLPSVMTPKKYTVGEYP